MHLKMPWPAKDRLLAFALNSESLCLSGSSQCVLDRTCITTPNFLPGRALLTICTKGAHTCSLYSGHSHLLYSGHSHLLAVMNGQTGLGMYLMSHISTLVLWRMISCSKRPLKCCTSQHHGTGAWLLATRGHSKAVHRRTVALELDFSQ